MMTAPVNQPLKVKVGTFTVSATGSQSVSGVGFRPKMVVFINQPATNTGGSITANGGFGVADGTSQWAVCWGARPSNSASARVSSTTECLLNLTLSAGPTTTVDTRAAFTSMGADGFTFNATVASVSNTFGYIAYG